MTSGPTQGHVCIVGNGPTQTQPTFSKTVSCLYAPHVPLSTAPVAPRHQKHRHSGSSSDYQVHPSHHPPPSHPHTTYSPLHVFHHKPSQTSRTLHSLVQKIPTAWRGNRKVYCIPFLVNPEPRLIETQDLVFLTHIIPCLYCLVSHHRSKCRAALDRCTCHGGAERTEKTSYYRD